MAIGVFPGLKLAVLFVKQISKPLAKFLVNQAKNYPVFRTYFIIPPAQFYHWAEVKTKMYIMNLGKPIKVAKLNDSMAIELGASLLSEVFIFSVGGACLILEYNRQAIKEAKKEENRQIQIQKFTNDIQALHDTTLQQEARIRYLQDAISELASHTRLKLQTSEPVLQIKNNNNNDLDDNIANSNKNNKSEIGADAGNQNSSLIERAIVYYDKKLKANKIS